MYIMLKIIVEHTYPHRPPEYTPLSFFIPFFLSDAVYEDLAQPELRSLHELVGT
jgi:hypothetical protein